MAESNVIQVYISSVSSNNQLKHKQQRIKMVLESKDIPHVLIDIAEANTDHKDNMRKIIGDDKALPPQIFKDGKYLGDYSAFDDAVESEDLSGFLGI